MSATVTPRPTVSSHNTTSPPKRYDAKTSLQYLDPATKLNRRYLSPGAALNTGKFEWKEVVVRDARPYRSDFNLESTGFCLIDHKSKVTDWNDKQQHSEIYCPETEAVIKSLTGADEVIAFEPTLRRASTTTAWQPFGSEVHVDYTQRTAEGLINAMLLKRGLDKSDFKRFQCINLWRTFSSPPQDYPLGMCDASSVGVGECRPNPRVKVDVLPNVDDVPAEEPPADTPAADMFSYRDHHRWWFFSDMKADEGLVFKLFDSDQHAKAPRCPHTAFHDRFRERAKPRESIEIRTVVCWK